MEVKTKTQQRDELAAAQSIYEPKYGGKDHTGYDTLMKYEVNYEREDCFIKGWDACELLMQTEADALKSEYENVCKFATDYENKCVDLESQLRQEKEYKRMMICKL